MKDAGEGLATARLQLRRFTASDIDWLAQLNGDPVVKRHMGGPATREASEAMLRDRILAYYQRHPGLGIWVTQQRADGDVIGMHLLNHIQGETLIQVGYVLFPQYWGRGYATEMCRALLRYGYAELGLPRIHAITDRPNLPSQNVLLKAGLHRNGERSFAAYAQGTPMAFFERDAAAWLAEQGA